MSQHYFISISGQQAGPFTFEELKAKRITADTLIWTEGLDKWTRAGDIPLLSDILGQAAPPPPPNSFEPPRYKDTKNADSINTPEGPYFGYVLAKKRERLLAAFIQELPLQIIVYILFLEAIQQDGIYNMPTFIGTSVIALAIGGCCRSYG